MEERVAAAVLEAYARLRVKDGGCWTVVAGVAAVAGDDVEVLSVASGCKCVGGPASPALVALMRACWQFDASERPSFSGILDELERIAAAAEITFD